MVLYLVEPEEEGAAPSGPPGSGGDPWPGFDIDSDPGITAPTGSGVYRYMSPTGAAAGEGLTDTAPISWARAHAIAQPGDTIIMEDGNYGELWAGGDTTKAGTNPYYGGVQRGPWGRLAGTAANPIIFCGRNAPTFDKDAAITGPYFGVPSTNDYDAMYLGNMSYVEFHRFTAYGGQSVLAVGFETGRPPLGPLTDCRFQYFHLFNGSQELVTFKHDSEDVYFEDFLIEVSNVSHIPNETGEHTEPGYASGSYDLGEGFYYGYNDTTEMTTGAHVPWQPASGPGDIYIKRGTMRDIEGAEAVDMKPQGTGSAYLEKVLIDGCTPCFSGAISANRSGSRIYLRDCVVKDVGKHYTCIYNNAATFGGFSSGSGVTMDNVIFLSTESDCIRVQSGTMVANHVTAVDCAELTYTSGGTGITDDSCVRINTPDAEGLGWLSGTGAEDANGPDYDDGLGARFIGAGARPSATTNYDTGGSQNPADDIEGTTRPGSSAAALGAVEPS